MANLFAEHFSNVFNDCSACVPDFANKENNLHISKIVTSQSEVKRYIDSLDVSKGCGPDCIPPRVLRHCSDLLSSDLACLFNSSLRRGVFPSGLKTSFVTPIFKAGDRSDVRNHRPITIQSPIVKIFEAIVLDRLKPVFGNIIVGEQHGFTPGRSTVTNLTVFSNFIHTSFSQGLQVDAIYLDFSKAFDKVCHKLLIQKLKGYGVCEPLLTWIQSYLTDRFSIVKYSTGLSDPFSVKSGVPQGSLLGPYLFNVFINDITEGIESKFLLYADDIKLFHPIKSSLDCNVLQRSLNHVVHWCEMNQMSLNVDKCKVITFSRGGHTVVNNYTANGAILERCNDIRDLGIHLTHSLSCELHVEDICTRARRLNGLIARAAKSGLTAQSLALLYKSFVLQVLEYGSVVWRPYQENHITRLQGMQRRFVRLVGFSLGYRYWEVPVEQLESLEFNLRPLEHRRAVADALFLFKLVRGIFDCPELLQQVEFRVPGATRSSDPFIRRSYSTNYSKNSPLPRLMRLGNTISGLVDFHFDSIDGLKRKLKHFDFPSL